MGLQLNAGMIFFETAKVFIPFIAGGIISILVYLLKLRKKVNENKVERNSSTKLDNEDIEGKNRQKYLKENEELELEILKTDAELKLALNKEKIRESEAKEAEYENRRLKAMEERKILDIDMDNLMDELNDLFDE